MTQSDNSIPCDVCVIGGGSAGLSFAAGASQMGANVVLVESGAMGGDCLNTGCVPSKALLAAAKLVDQCRHADDFGLSIQTSKVDMKAVMASVHQVIDAIAPNDSVERFEGLGVRVIQAAAQFVDAKTLRAGDTTIKAKHYVIATGGRAAVPPIPGLSDVPYLTNENLFELTELPDHLLIVGAGPIGCEMAQAFRLLGANVTLMEAVSMMPHDDAVLVGELRDVLVSQGIAVHEGIAIDRVSTVDGGIEVSFKAGNKPQIIVGSHLLVAAGRKPNIEGLGLEAAGVKATPRGIEVNERLQTSQRRITAIGDVVGPYQFTHMASYQAGIAIQNILFKLPVKVNYQTVPWVTYTHPELAQVGMTWKDAEDKIKGAKLVEWTFAENDRAMAERATAGRIRVSVDKKGRVLGVSILGPHAGELIAAWVPMVRKKLLIKCMSDNILPYPTLNEASKRVAGAYYTPLLYSTRTKRVVRWLMRWL